LFSKYMRFSNVFVASVVLPLVPAHKDIPGAHKIFGLSRDLKARAPTQASSRRKGVAQEKLGC